jgi:hypothetical protein
MTKSTRSIAAMFLFLLALAAWPQAAQAQGTAFIYQGRLMESNAPANGIFEFEFSLFDRVLGGNNLGTLTLEETPVSNGLFTVVLDFGAGAFNGAARWLEIYARNDGAGGAGVLLTPRQPVMPTPHAMFAAQAAQAATATTATSATNLIGSVSVNQLAGQITSLHLSDGLVANQHVSPTAAIVDTKLATIATAGKVANSATTATRTNSAHTIVLRDATGSFAANQIVADAGFVGNGSSITGLNADNVTTGTINNARLSSSVTLLGNTIEPSELAKPYYSGRLSVSNKAELSIHRVPFTVSFPQPFAAPPAVTLGLQVGDANADEQYRATLNSVTTTGFTAAVYTPPPYGYQNLFSSGWGDLVAASNILGVAVIQGASTYTNLIFARQTNGGYYWDDSTAVTNRHLRGPLSAASVSGQPAITYYDMQMGQHRYVRATDPLGTSWASPVSIITTSNANVSQLVIVSGRPALAHLDDSAGYRGRVRFLRANDSIGASWPAATLVATNIAGYRPSLAIIGGLPAIAFHDYTTDRLYFTIASNSAGTAWSAPVQIECCNLSNPNVSLAEVGGFPAVAFLDDDGAAYRVTYRRAGDAQGSIWPISSRRTIEYSGYFPTLGVCDGRPFLFWQGVSSETGLRYTQGLDAAGTSWTKNINLTSESGGGISAKVIQGRLSVASQEGFYLNVFQPFPQFDLNWSATAP